MGILEGKVAIVTGAGHGIGRGHAMELAKQGAKVVVNDLGGSERGEGSGSAAEDTVKLIEERGGVAVPNFADVSDYDLSGEMVQQAIDEFGKLDILVNNAGIVRDAAIWNMKVEDWDAVMRVHVRGTWCPTHHASKHWRERAKEGPLQARIVNTTSGAGLGGNFGQTSYATAKAAIVGMTLTLAQELYKTGVTANCIGPAGLTRITATMPGSEPALEPDTRARGRVEPHGPEELVTGGRVARERRRAVRDGPGDPGGPRPAHPHAGVDREAVRVVRRQGVGRGTARVDHGHRDLRLSSPRHALRRHHHLDHPRTGVSKTRIPSFADAGLMVTRRRGLSAGRARGRGGCGCRGTPRTRRGSR